jgi:hypothetical protein
MNIEKQKVRKQSIHISKITSIHNAPLLLFKSLDIASQLCLICYNIFKKCRAKEFLNLNWSKKYRLELAPNVCNMIDRSNKVGSWIVQEVLKQENIRERVEYLKLFIKVANHCYNLHNFNTLVEVMSGK